MLKPARCTETIEKATARASRQFWWAKAGRLYAAAVAARTEAGVRIAVRSHRQVLVVEATSWVAGRVGTVVQWGDEATVQKRVQALCAAHRRAVEAGGLFRWGEQRIAAQKASQAPSRTPEPGLYSRQQTP